MNNQTCWTPDRDKLAGRKVHSHLAVRLARASHTNSPARTGLRSPSCRPPFAARRHLRLHARAGCRSPASIRGSPASPPPRSHRLSLAGRDVLPPFSVALPPLVARAPATLPRLHLPSHDLRPASATPRCLHARANCRSPPCCRILSSPLCPPPAAATTRFLRLPQQPRWSAFSAYGSHRAWCCRSCPARIGEVSKTRIAPRHEGR